MQHHAHDSGEGDEQNGVELFQGGVAHGDKDHHGQDQGGPVDGDGLAQRDQHGHGHRQSGGGDEGGGGGAQAIEHGVHRFGLAEFFQEAGDDDDDHDGGEGEAQGGHDGPDDAGDAVEPGDGKAHIGGHVHPHGAGGGLGHGDHGAQVGGGEPAGAGPQVLKKWDGGKAPAHGEQAGLGKLKKQAQQDHLPSPPFPLCAKPRMRRQA